MSKELPTWEDDRSDIKLEYRLQYAHVIISMQDIDQVIKKTKFAIAFPTNLFVLRLGALTKSALKSWRPLMSASEIRSEWLPDKKGIVLLNDADKWHFIFALFGQNIVVFAPHFLFLGSRRWIRLSRKLGALLGYVDYDIDLCYYTLFKKGKHICNVSLGLEGIHQSKMGAWEFYLDKKLIHKVDEENDLLTQELKDFIADDVIIDIDRDRQVHFKKPLTEAEYREPSAVRHVVFPARWDLVPEYNRKTGVVKRV